LHPRALCLPRSYGLDLFLLSIDEGITGYRDDSLETVKRNEATYGIPLLVVGSPHGQACEGSCLQPVKTVGTCWLACWSTCLPARLVSLSIYYPSVCICLSMRPFDPHLPFMQYWICMYRECHKLISKRVWTTW